MFILEVIYVHHGQVRKYRLRKKEEKEIKHVI